MLTSEQISELIQEIQQDIPIDPNAHVTYDCAMIPEDNSIIVMHNSSNLPQNPKKSPMDHTTIPSTHLSDLHAIFRGITSCKSYSIKLHIQPPHIDEYIKLQSHHDTPTNIVQYNNEDAKKINLLDTHRKEYHAPYDDIAHIIDANTTWIKHNATVEYHVAHIDIHHAYQQYAPSIFHMKIEIAQKKSQPGTNINIYLTNDQINFVCMHKYTVPDDISPAQYDHAASLNSAFDHAITELSSTTLNISQHERINYIKQLQQYQHTPKDTIIDHIIQEHYTFLHHYT